MDFFDRQAAARKSSKLLVVFFVIGVLGIAVSVGLLASWGMMKMEAGYNPVMDTSIIYKVGGATLILILLGSLFKTMSLGAGGSAVARSLGGHRINPDSADIHERVLLNIVEEMSIACGIAVPEVYMLEDEHGINAFAAGRTTSDAVIGVTRGCVRRLTRDELQGVIAHEFSHILNGDMRLNLRLIGLLFGILMIALCGRAALHAMPRSSSRNKDDGKAQMVILLIGVALLIIGYLGVLMANLIKAAVSRQREFLADASAVQFTRNPQGIGGALKKIGGFAEGSKLSSHKAEEASHLFFSHGLKAAMFNAFATHPPIDERIRAIDPQWDGVYPGADYVFPLQGGENSPAAPGISSLAGTKASGEAHPAALGLAETIPVTGILDHVGEMKSGHVAHARQFHAFVSGALLAAARSELGSKALVLAMLLPEEEALREAGLKQLEQAGIHFDSHLRDPDCLDELAGLSPALKIPLIDLAIPSLRRMDQEEYEQFLALMNALIESDRQVDLFEFMLQRIVRRHLDIHFNRHKASEDRYKSVAVLVDEIAVLLSSLAGLSSEDPSSVDYAFAAGAAEIEPFIGGKLPFKQASVCGLQHIDDALGRVEHAIAPVKKIILQACGKAVVADGIIAPQEAELLRAIADALDCPVPPFVTME